MSPVLKCVALRVLQLPRSSLHWETRVFLWKVSLKMPAVFSRLDTVFFWKDPEAVTAVIAASAVLVTTYCFCLLFTAVIGLLYPCIDRHLGEPHKFKREWSSVMRCVAVFVGINHASAVSLMKPAGTRQPAPPSHNTVLTQLLTQGSKCEG